MVVQLPTVQWERLTMVVEMAMAEVDVECWTKARREQAVDEQSVDVLEMLNM